MSKKTTQQIAEELKALLEEKTGLDFLIQDGKNNNNNKVLSGPQGSMMFWLSEDRIVYLVDVLADAPTIIETVLFLLEKGLDLVYSGPYITHPNGKEYIIGSSSYEHKETWLKRFAAEIKSNIILPS